MAKHKQYDSISLSGSSKRPRLHEDTDFNTTATSSDLTKDSERSKASCNEEKINQQLSGLELLPTEIWQDIITLLPHASILSLLFVSRRVHQAAWNGWLDRHPLPTDYEYSASGADEGSEEGASENDDATDYEDSDSGADEESEEASSDTDDGTIIFKAGEHDEEEMRMRFRIESEFSADVKLVELRCSECFFPKPALEYVDEHKTHKRLDRLCLECFDCADFEHGMEFHVNGERIFRCEACSDWIESRSEMICQAQIEEAKLNCGSGLWELAGFEDPNCICLSCWEKEVIEVANDEEVDGGEAAERCGMDV